MIKEELEKDFYKYLKDSSDYYDPREPLTDRKLLQMWLDCAEPREKRIADLEEQNKELILKISRLESACDAYNYSQRTYQEEIKELKAENEQIKNSDTLCKLIGEQKRKITELEQQIEKMKNWCNCKNYQQCLIELAEQGKGMNPSECCRNCKKWEIKEND